MRFANRFFVPLWNRDNIANIQVNEKFLESAVSEHSGLQCRERYGVCKRDMGGSLDIKDERREEIGAAGEGGRIRIGIDLGHRQKTAVGQKQGDAKLQMHPENSTMPFRKPWTSEVASKNTHLMLSSLFEYIADCFQGGFWN
jgi:hypothetical protein